MVDFLGFISGIELSEKIKKNLSQKSEKMPIFDPHDLEYSELKIRIGKYEFNKRVLEVFNYLGADEEVREEAI